MLQLKEITKIFNKGTPEEVTALKSISLNVRKGEFLAIIGDNGSGKSTLLNVIAGIQPIDKGILFLDGQDVTNEAEFIRSRQIGRVYQDTRMGTAPSLTIEENLALAQYKNRGVNLRFYINPSERSKFRGLLKSLELNLENRLETKVKHLSGGERQILSLQMSVMGNPKILLLDEHVAALAPVLREKAMNLTNKLQQESNLTVLMVTHNLADAAKNGNRLIMMHKGCIVSDISGPEKQSLTLESILRLFQEKRASLTLRNV